MKLLDASIRTSPQERSCFGLWTLGSRNWGRWWCLVIQVWLKMATSKDMFVTFSWSSCVKLFGLWRCGGSGCEQCHTAKNEWWHVNDEWWHVHEEYADSTVSSIKHFLFMNTRKELAGLKFWLIWFVNWQSLWPGTSCPTTAKLRATKRVRQHIVEVGVSGGQGFGWIWDAVDWAKLLAKFSGFFLAFHRLLQSQYLFKRLDLEDLLSVLVSLEGPIRSSLKPHAFTIGGSGPLTVTRRRTPAVEAINEAFVHAGEQAGEAETHGMWKDMMCHGATDKTVQNSQFLYIMIFWNCGSINSILAAPSCQSPVADQTKWYQFNCHIAVTVW